MRPQRSRQTKVERKTFRRGALFAVILLLGTLGWRMSRAPGSCGTAGWVGAEDAVYRAWQLFVLNYAPLECQGWLPSPLLLLIRFVAPAFLAIEFILAFSSPIRNFFMVRFYGTTSPQYLIIGYGRVGQGLAKGLRATRAYARIVALDRHVRPLDSQEADFANTELFEADARELASIRAIPFKLADAERIFVALGDDEQTIAAAAAVAAATGSRRDRVWMQLNDNFLLDRLRNAPLLAKPGSDRPLHSFSLAEAAGIELVARYRPALLARRLGQNRLHAVLVRFDSLAWAMAEALVIFGIAPPTRLARPRLTIVDQDAGAHEERWRARHPDLWKYVDLTFIKADPGGLCWAGRETRLEHIETLDPPTLYIFGRDKSPGAAAADALSLRLGMEKAARQPAPIFLASDVDGMETLSTHEVPADLQDQLAIIGRAADLAALSHAVEPYLEKLAQALHFQYRARHGGPEFSQLPETLQVSNRRAALNVVQILLHLGFEQTDLTKPAFGLSRAAVEHMRSLFPNDNEICPAEPEIAGQCAEYEHLRWCADRVADGWCEGPRDEEARRREQLAFGRFKYRASLDQEHGHLPVAEQVKDLQLMRDAVDFLAAQCHERRPDFIRMHNDIPDLTLGLRWSAPGERLALAFIIDPSWEDFAPADKLHHKRLTLLVPPEPPLLNATENADRGRPETPASRATARTRAYREFAETCLAGAPPNLHFRLARARREGWNWLSEIDPSIHPRIDGYTLPPLTIGFAGNRDLGQFGPETSVVSHVASQLESLLTGLRARGRQMRLVTGAAEGADSVMIEVWSKLELGPILGLYPARPLPLRAVDRLVAVREIVPTALEADARHQDVGRRIIDSCDVLIAVNGQSVNQGPGGTIETMTYARQAGIDVIQVTPC